MLRTYIQYKVDRSLPFLTITYGAFGNRVRVAASRFLDLGIEKGDRVAIVSESRPEWLIGDFALMLIGAISVPMFPTLTQKQVEHILVDSGAKAVIVSNELQLGKALKSLPQTPDISWIILLNSETAIPDEAARKVTRWSAIEAERITSRPLMPAFVTDDDVVTIIYTSGTTGVPRGVMLTHKNLVANVEGALAAIPAVTPVDIFLSFLPLSHSFERIASYLIFYAGASIAFAHSIDTVSENMLEIRPTVMTGVPRFFERVYGRVMKLREGMPERKKKIFDWAMKVGQEVGRKEEGLSVSIFAEVKHLVADRLMLKKIRERTGGRIRFFVSGAAALNAEVGRAFAGFGLPIVEGYGMTETSPVISVTPFGKIKWGKVGLPLKNVEVKIADDGEILARGPSVMKGYYNMLTETGEVIDREGWMHTGDIGVIDEDGYLVITDRKKHLFISSGGKNIAPAHVEALLEQSPLIDQVMLIGDKRQFVTAIIVPDFEAIKALLTKSGKTLPSLESEVLTDPLFRDLIEAEIDLRLKDVATYERVRRFALLGSPFSIENGMLTPTFKIKRKEVEKRYSDLIESLYFVQ
jgi:long-chain acyl-CoA synthetase